MRDEVLSLVRNVGPTWIRECKLSNPDLLHDLLVTLPVERRHSRKNDVEDDSAGPDVALLIVLLVEHFWCNIIGGSKFFIEGLGRIIY